VVIDRSFLLLHFLPAVCSKRNPCVKQAVAEVEAQKAMLPDSRFCHAELVEASRNR
jgi:hypothetical protein